MTYVDGPFYGDESLKGRQQRKELRDRVYAAMTERSRENTVERIQYVREGEPAAEKSVEQGVNQKR